MSEIEWRIVAVAPGYEVSSDGRVRNRETGEDRALTLVKNKYHTVRLRSGLGTRTFGVHQLVAWAFLGQPTGPLVRHLNDMGTDNRAANLAYGSHSDNRLDAVRNGIHPQANRTACIHGHEFTPENTYVYTPPGATRSRRMCKECDRAKNRRRWANGGYEELVLHRKEQVPCIECGKSITRNNMQVHVKSQHAREYQK